MNFGSGYISTASASFGSCGWAMKATPPIHHHYVHSLSSVSEDLDDVLKIVQGKGKKPTTKKVPPASVGSSRGKASGGLFDSDDTTDIPEMGTDDIMKYIQQNQEAAEGDLDLF